MMIKIRLASDKTWACLSQTSSLYNDKMITFMFMNYYKAVYHIPKLHGTP